MLTLGGVLARVGKPGLANPAAAGTFAGVPPMRVEGDASVEITDVTNDSRMVRHGSIFCCVRGEHFDGHEFAADAVQQGASALLVDHALGSITVPQIIASDTRSAMGHLAAAFHDHPSTTLTVVGVTGTNGKTTTAHMLGAILSQSGRRTNVFGTLSGTRTTPEAPELQRTLANERDAGTQAVVMEVSSHALELQRVAGMRFAAAVFTNLGHDHLDFHRTHDAYFAAKASLFTGNYTSLGVVNRDDIYGRKIADTSNIAISMFGYGDASDVVMDANGSSFTWRGARIHCAVGGDFNVLNALAAATTAAELGISMDHIAAGLATMSQIPGRFEKVRHPGDFLVLVDYAHTPEALRNVIAAARGLVGDGSRSGVTVVFGCGGDRDPSKRAEMGSAACEADRIVVTSDNPRHESPEAIIDAIVTGIPDSHRSKLVVEVDRRRAIEEACASASAGDVVVIAGRGHENMQSVAGAELAFNDASVAREVLGVRK